MDELMIISVFIIRIVKDSKGLSRHRREALVAG